MNNNDLLEIRNDLNKFYRLISAVKINHPLTYDKFLNYPTWRNNHASQPDDYADAILADLAKFSTHVDMLQHPSNLIQDSNNNSKAITATAERLNHYVETYMAFTKKIANKDLCVKIKNKLGNLEQILQIYSNNFRRPSN